MSASRYSKQYDEQTVNSSIHLKKYITPSPNDRSFKCGLCKGDSRLYENLLIHLESDAHLKKLPDTIENKAKLVEAIALLAEKGFRSKVSPVSSNSRKQSAEKAKDDNNLVKKNEPTQEEEEMKREKTDQRTTSNSNPKTPSSDKTSLEFEITKFILQNSLPFSLTKKLILLINHLCKTFDSTVLTSLSTNKNNIGDSRMPSVSLFKVDI